MSETPKRFILRGRLHSPQEMQDARERAEHAQSLNRLPGEGLHEYVRRVSAGEYQAIRTIDLNTINDANSNMRRELGVLRVQLRQNIGDSPDPGRLTATQIVDQMMRTRRRVEMDAPRGAIPVDLRGLAIDTEERLMVGGPMDGRIMQFRADTDHYQARETEGLDISDIRDSASRSMTTRTTVHTYLLFRRDNYIPMMIVQDLLNSPRSVQDAHVNRAMRMAGIDI